MQRASVRETALQETWEPVPDRTAAATLRAALDAVGYGEDGVADLLGDDGPAADLGDVPVFERRLPVSPLATAIRLLLLELPVGVGEAVEALGGEAVETLEEIGLAFAGAGRTLVPRARVVPAEGLLLACDGFPRGANDPPGYVASFSPTASWCASLTPRRRAARALDVGTGNGAQALLAAGHSTHVIATDVNPRALAYTSLNAALNRIENVETRLGSLYEPVAGEQFDLITCNAPYVVSPESRWQYRDGGLPADRLSELVVSQAGSLLTEGGYATLLVSWLAESEEKPDERVRAWLDGNGCDAWILGLSGADPLDHAAGWNDHLTGEPDAFGAALDEWAAYFEAIGAGWITEGAVLLHRRTGESQVVRADAVSEDDLEFAGEQVERVFAAHASLAGLDGPHELLRSRLALVHTARIEHRLDPRGGGQETRMLLDEGTCPELALDPEVAEIVAALDGRISVDNAIEGVVRQLELTRRAADELRRAALDAVSDLLELGFVEVR